MRAPLPPWTHRFVADAGKLTQEFFAFLRDVDGVLKASAPNVQTASYTLVEQDAGGKVEMNVGSANNLTVPPSSTVAFDVGTRIQITQAGAGQTTLVAGAGVTIRARVGLKIIGQWGVAYLDKRGTDEWVASGDLSA